MYIIYQRIITIIMSTPVVIPFDQWNPEDIKYMAPKVNDRGGKAISLIYPGSKRSLHITTPALMTWGISVFVGENGEAVGNHKISLNFPGEGYDNAATNSFLDKCKKFEAQVLKDAVKNSASWWGEELELGVLKHTFFSWIKYQKDKNTKKNDFSKPPSIGAKVSCYNSKWDVEIYDTKQNRIFPCENEDMTPMDFVPKLSNVMCVLQCTGIWIGGKGWGLTWKLVQCIVKPKHVETVAGRCHLMMDVEDDVDEQESEPVVVTAPVKQQKAEPVVVVTVPAKQSVEVEDSDDDEPAAAANAEEQKPVVEEEEEQEAAVEEPAPKPVVVKKVVKKAAPIQDETVVPPTPPPSEEPKPVIKKVVKKKV